MEEAFDDGNTRGWSHDLHSDNVSIVKESRGRPSANFDKELATALQGQTNDRSIAEIGSMPQRKAEVKTTDLPDEMQQYAVEMAFAAIRGSRDNQEIASYIRTAMMEEYPGNWHCIVGSNFGSEVTHGKRGLIFFRLAGHGILLFRTV